MGVSRALGVAVFALALIFLISFSDADVMASAGKSWASFGAGQDAVFSMDRDDISFTEIRFTLKNMTENVDIELDVLSDNDTVIEALAPDEVYEYVRLMPTNIQVANLESAAIRFRVANSWISGNDIENISLYRYETSWSVLDTSLIWEDEDHQYYETPVEKFSLFAISGEKGEAESLCSPYEDKCIANDLYQCSEDGAAWNLTENCAYGCEAGACRIEPSCPECPEAGKECSPGEQKCSGNGQQLQQCNSEGTGWDMVRDCPEGCILCAEGQVLPQTDIVPLHMAIIICQAMIALLLVIVIALFAYLWRHK